MPDLGVVVKYKDFGVIGEAGIAGRIEGGRGNSLI